MSRFMDLIGWKRRQNLQGTVIPDLEVWMEAEGPEVFECDCGADCIEIDGHHECDCGLRYD